MISGYLKSKFEAAGKDVLSGCLGYKSVARGEFKGLVIIIAM